MARTFSAEREAEMRAALSKISHGWILDLIAEIDAERAVSTALAEALQLYVDHFGDPLKVALTALAAYRDAVRSESAPSTGRGD